MIKWSNHLTACLYNYFLLLCTNIYKLPKSITYSMTLMNSNFMIAFITKIPLNSDLVPVLKHKSQRQVTCVEWKPMSCQLLAVACRNSIILWQVDPCSLLTRPSTNCIQIIDCSRHHLVTSIKWCPRGSDLLYSVSAFNSKVLVSSNRVWYILFPF